jgi:beta-lactamase regulating signal transducer with metallopeptidase domain
MMVDGLLAYLINAAWQAPLLAAGAWTLTRVSQLEPRGRNRVWLACLALSVVLPLVDLSAAPPIIQAPVPATEHSPAAVDLRAAPTPAMPAAAHTTQTVREPEIQAPPRLALKLNDRIALGLIAVFAAALAIGLGRLLVGWFAVRRLVRKARPVILPSSVAAELATVAKSHGARMPDVLQSTQIESPVAAGAWRPVILISTGFTDRSEDELRAALLHELAHVIRRDYAVNLLSEVAALPLCWHPALHAIKAEVRRSRELVCDAMASAAMRSESVYARSLLSLAQSLESRPQESKIAGGASMAIGLFGKSLLEERVMHLIGPKKSVGGAPKTVELIAGGVIAAGVVGVAALLHVSAALAQPEAPAKAHTSMVASAAMTTAVSDTHVVIDNGRYEHRWTSASGRSYDLRNNDPKDPSPADQARVEHDVDGAEAEAAKAEIEAAKAEGEAAKTEGMVNSQEIKEAMAQAVKAQDMARVAEAEATRAMNDPKIKAAIAEGQRLAADSHLRLEAQAQAMKALNDPQVKAAMAQARDSQRLAMLAQAEAMKALDDPKVKAEIERARHIQNSPEMRDAQRKLREAAERLRKLESEDAPRS